MRPTLLALLVAATVLAPAAAADDTAPRPKTTQELLDASNPTDWRTLDPADTLYLELASGRVVIELAPEFAPEHVGNIRTLAREGYWNGLSINRSQDNFVVQWGDPAEEGQPRRPLGKAKTHLPAEFERDAAGLDFHALPDKDGLQWLRAKPHSTADAGYAQVDIGMRDNLPVRILLLDAFGQTTRVDLSGLQANASVPASQFQFTAPKGTDVVRM